MADVSVRPAMPADAGDIAAVQLAAWRAGYAEILPPEVLAGPPEDLATAWHATLSAPTPPRHRVLVAAEGHQVVGIAVLSSSDSPDADELAALLVLPSAGRRGHGSRLLAAAVDGWRAAGVAEAVAWVWRNDRVLSTFLLSAGWGFDGGRRGLDTSLGVEQQLRLRTQLSMAPSGGLPD